MEDFREDRHDQKHSVESSGGREDSLEEESWRQGGCL